MLAPSSPIEILRKVGPAYLKKLHKLEIKTIGDLLFYFPFRYEDFSNLIPIVQLKEGEKATILGEVADVKLIRVFKRRMTIVEALIEDKTGSIKATWFNQPWLASTLKKGKKVYISGTPSVSKNALSFSFPVYELAGGKGETTHTGRLVPIYHETLGLTSRYLRYLIKPLLPLSRSIEDFLPEETRRKNQLAELWWAVRHIHFPARQSYLKKARERLAFNELFLIQLAALNQKRKLQSKRAVTIGFDQKLIKSFVDSLPYKLTKSQKIAAWEILQNIEKEAPMNRLLNGDVGSGKTVVAAIAALQTAKCKYQTALMAPTEILARQHFKTFKEFLKGQRLKIALLISAGSILNNKKTTKKELKNKIKKSQVDIVIGTHALIQKDVLFKNLALAIIDEQHRFGVSQRAALLKAADKKDGLETAPHFLSMTATPIPRTLALTAYGDLDMSIIPELPRERKKIITQLITPKKRTTAYSFIKKRLHRKEQAFFICPLIGQSEKLDQQRKDSFRSEIKSVEKEFENLSKKIFPEFKLGFIHGRMKSKEKEEIMDEFRENKINILVATSVIEVGIDMPNATVMVIEDADRFGLAQLHQMRGRIGRSKKQSYCLLFTDMDNPQSNKRLKALIRSQNGFELAEQDLKLRGPGDFTGIRQWGLPDLVMASLNDLELIKKSRLAARQVLESNSLNPALEKKLKRQSGVHLE